MDTHTIFNGNRFFLLLRNDLFRNYRTLLIGAATVAAIYFIATLSPLIFSHESVDYDFNTGFFPTVLFICGFLLSAATFSEIHHSLKNISFFMLPATKMEKFISRLFLTTIGFIVFSTVFYLILNLISAAITGIFSYKSIPVLNPFSREMLIVFAIYLVTQSVFIFGSVYFKSHPLMKTGLSLFGLAVGLGVFTAIVFRIVFSDFFDHMQFMDDYMASDFLYLEDLGETLLTIIKYIFWLVMAPFFWVVSYIRLGEKEV